MLLNYLPTTRQILIYIYVERDTLKSELMIGYIETTSNKARCAQYSFDTNGAIQLIRDQVISD